MKTDLKLYNELQMEIAKKEKEFSDLETAWYTANRNNPIEILSLGRFGEHQKAGRPQVPNELRDLKRKADGLIPMDESERKPLSPCCKKTMFAVYVKSNKEDFEREILSHAICSECQSKINLFAHINFTE